MDQPALDAHLRASAGLFAGLVAYCCTAIADRKPAAALHHPASLDELAPWAVTLGVAIGAAGLIGETGDHARHGRIYLPVDAMQQHNVSAASLLQRQYDSAYTALMQEQAALAHQSLITALAAMPATQRRAQRCLMAEAAMARGLLDEIRRERFQVLHQRIALTPVRNLLIAWWATR